MDTIKFNPQIKWHIYEDLTKSPILSVTQKRSEIGKHFVGYENLQFILKSGSGLSSTELKSQPIALSINCMDCPATDCVLHVRNFSCLIFLKIKIHLLFDICSSGHCQHVNALVECWVSFSFRSA